MNGNRLHIFLAGFAGSGKSTVGRMLARKMRRHFVDLDSAIERHTRSTIRELIDGKGERYFRNIESRTLGALCRKLRQRAVISLGGGTLLSSANRRVVARYGITVYLSCSRRTLVKRLRKSHDRPLIPKTRTEADRDARIKRLLSVRMPGYKSCDHAVIVTKLTPQQVVRRIRELVR